MQSDESPLPSFGNDPAKALTDPLGRLVGEIVHVERHAKTGEPAAYVVSLAPGLPRVLVGDAAGGGVRRIDPDLVRHAEAGLALKVGLADLRALWDAESPTSLELMDDDEDGFDAGFAVADAPVRALPRRTSFMEIMSDE